MLKKLLITPLLISNIFCAEYEMLAIPQGTPLPVIKQTLSSWEHKEIIREMCFLGCGLSELPEEIALFTGLTALSLADNPDLRDKHCQVLQKLKHLETVHLNLNEQFFIGADKTNLCISKIPSLKALSVIAVKQVPLQALNKIDTIVR